MSLYTEDEAHQAVSVRILKQRRNAVRRVRVYGLALHRPRRDETRLLFSCAPARHRNLARSDQSEQRMSDCLIFDA
jgi:hypothetical protein